MSSKSWREAMVKEGRAQGLEEKRPGELQRKMLQKHDFNPNGQA